MIDFFQTNKFLALCSLSLCLLNACATLRGKEPPADLKGMSVAELVELTRIYDTKIMRRVYRQLQREQKLAEAGNYIADQVQKERADYTTVELSAILHLYQLTGDPNAHQLFTLLTADTNPILTQTGWQIATLMPSAKMATAIVQKVETEVAQGRERTLFLPQAANALRANNIRATYTLMRAALRDRHHEAFAQAMIALAPKSASGDFITYLANTTSDELRQQTPTSVNVLSCLVMLEHLRKYPLSPYHQRFEVLFWYAISRNPALSQASREVLETYYANHAVHLAQLLARLPFWAQFSFVENIGRELTPTSRKFLTILKQTTSGVDVIDQINQVIR